MCYYFNEIMKIEDFDFDETFLDEKANENTLIYDILSKGLIRAKPLRIMFHKW